MVYIPIRFVVRMSRTIIIRNLFEIENKVTQNDEIVLEFFKQSLKASLLIQALILVLGMEAVVELPAALMMSVRMDNNGFNTTRTSARQHRQ